MIEFLYGIWYDDKAKKDFMVLKLKEIRKDRYGNRNEVWHWG